MKSIYLPILMYHNICEGQPQNTYALSTKSFEEQISYLSQNEFRTITPEEIAGLKESSDKKKIMITFDDGYETDYTLALPILMKYGFKGVSFVTTGLLGMNGYLKWEQVHKLISGGFSIQSHTNTHQLLRSISYAAIQQELLISKKLIEENLKTKVTCLSLPGGSDSKKIKEIAFNLGYHYIFNSKPVINIINGQTIDSLGRIPITQKISLDKFKKIVNFDKKTAFRLKLDYSIKNITRISLGEKKYYHLWSQHNKNKDRKWQ
jgi:peptidoglycan/xylan/chitin deacetylase (PgdA/CDA1 family)